MCRPLQRLTRGEDDVCTSTLGTVTGTITTDFECTSTATDARVEFVQGTDIPISVRPDEEGRFTIDLDAGSWDVEGFGWADLEQRVPVTPLTRFRIGSVSKPLTAAALGLLVERGELDLDAPVQEYVPDFPTKRWPITTRQVAGHVAGIRHYQGLEFRITR